ncbi:MAG: AsmA-like C-terminal domain-containing protein [Candidatus Methylomirabilales bacterium]
MVTRGLRIARRILLGLLLLLTLVATGLHLALTTEGVQGALRTRLEAELSRRLRRQVQIEKVKLSPFLNYLEVRQVTVRGPGRTPFFQVRSLRFYPDLRRLLGRVLAIRTVVLLHPVLNLPVSHGARQGRAAEGSIPPLPVPSKIQGLLAFQVDRLQIREGELTYRRRGHTWSFRGLDADLWQEGVRVLGEVRVAEGGVHLPKGSLAWGNLQALAVLREHELVITRMGIDLGEGSLGLSGRVLDPFGERTLELKLTAGLPLTRLVSLPGSIRLEGQLNGSALNPHFRGSARVGGEKLPDLGVEIAADQEGLRGEGLRLLAVPGKVSGGFSLRWEDLSYTADVQARGLPLDALLRPFLETLPVTGTVATRVVAKGRGLSATGLTAEMTFQVASLRLGDKPGINGRAKGLVKAERGRFALQRFRLDFPPNHLTLKGTPAEDLNLQVSGRFPRVDKVGRLLGAKDLAGSGQVVGKVTGPMRAPTFQGTVTWNAPRLLGVRLTQIRGDVLIEGRRLKAPRLIVSRGKSTGTIRLRLILPAKKGTIDLKQDLRMEVEGQVKGVPEDLLSLFIRKEIPLTGRLTLDATVQGAPSRLKGEGHFRLKDAVFLGESWPVVEGDLELQPDRLLLKQVRLARGGQQMTGTALLDMADLETTFRLASAGLSLEGFHLFTGTGLTGKMRVEILGEGRIEDPRVRGDYEVKGLRYFSLLLGEGTGSLLFQDGEMTVQLALPERGYSVSGILRTAPPYAYNVQVTMKQADLAPLFALTDLPLLKGGAGRGSGTAQVVGELTSDRPVWLTLEFDAPHLFLRGQAFQTAEPFRLEMSGGLLTISSLSLRGEEGWLKAGGEIALDGPVELDVHGQIPLALLLREPAAIAEVAGTAALELQVSGLWAAPRYRGEVKLEGVGLRLAGHPEGFEEIEGRVNFQGTEIHIPTLEGRWAGGKVNVSGTASRTERGGWEWVLDLVLDGADGERVFAKEKGVKGGVTGRTSLWGKVTAKGRGWEELQQSLGGKLKVVFKEGKVRRFTVLANILRLLNLSLDPVEGIPYDHLKAVFHLQEGVAETQDLRFVSSTMKVGGVGKIDLVRGKVDMLLGVQPLRTVDKIVNFLQLSKIPLLGHLLFGKEKSVLVVPVKVKGPLTGPEVNPVPLASLGRGVFGVLRRVLELPAELLPAEQSESPERHAPRD